MSNRKTKLVGTTVRGDSKGNETVMEKQEIDLVKGTKEITFMHEDRIKSLKKRGHFEKYIKKYDKVEGKDIKSFIALKKNIK